MDGRPDAAPGLRVEGRTAGLLVERERLAERRHVVDRDDDLEVERLPCAGVDDGDRAARAGAAEETGDGFEWALGGAQADALRRVRVLGAQMFELLEAEREMRAALAAGDRVDLVDDHVLDPAEGVAGLPREHQIAIRAS